MFLGLRVNYLLLFADLHQNQQVSANTMCEISRQSVKWKSCFFIITNRPTDGRKDEIPNVTKANSRFFASALQTRLKI